MGDIREMAAQGVCKFCKEPWNGGIWLEVDGAEARLCVARSQWECFEHDNGVLKRYEFPGEVERKFDGLEGWLDYEASWAHHWCDEDVTRTDKLCYWSRKRGSKEARKRISERTSW